MKCFAEYEVVFIQRVEYKDKIGMQVLNGHDKI